MSLRVPPWRSRLAAADPGRARLTDAFTISSAVLISALAAWAIVHFLDAEGSLISIGVFLPFLLGRMTKDPTGPKRLVTTALAIVPICLSFALALALEPWRAAAVAGFIAVAGASMWVRRFGGRATTLGSIMFFSYFFAGIQRSGLPQLWGFVLVGTCAVAAMLLARSFALLAFPRRQITILVRELRAASAAAIATATRASAGDARAKAVHRALIRVDGIAAAITTWQSQHATARYLGCDEAAFATLVLDARIEIDHACLACAALARNDGTDLTAALHDLRTVLSEHAADDDRRRAADRAAAQLERTEPTDAMHLAVVNVCRATGSQQALDSVVRHPDEAPAERAPAPPPQPAPKTPAQPATTAESTSATPDPRFWHHWRYTSRMAVQVMIAALIATVAGEAISASKWYWAVLTAWLVFVGTTTRGAILTRAWRRILGTVGGLVVGYGLAVLLDGDRLGLILVSVLTVFAALYFGPLRYTFVAFFMTVLVVMIFDLLGALDLRLLDMRLDETVVGAVIGVACAYLIFSSNSRSVLIEKTTAYFDAIDDVLGSSHAALDGADADRRVLAAVHRLDAASSAVTTTAAAMTTALEITRRSPVDRLEQMMTTTDHFAEDVGRWSIDAAHDLSTTGAPAPAPAQQAYERAFGVVLDTSQRARAIIIHGAPGAGPALAEGTPVLAELANLPYSRTSPQVNAIKQLSRVDWALRRTIDIRLTR